MGIFRSGVFQAVRVRSLKDLKDAENSVERGEIVEVVLAMDTMYIIRTKNGREMLVSKTDFEETSDEP